MFSNKSHRLTLGILALSFGLVLSGCQPCPSEQTQLEVRSMRLDLTTHERALDEILNTDDPAIVKENLLVLERNYENRIADSVPACAEPARTALLQTLEVGIRIAELKLQNTSEDEIQAAIQEMEASREIFDAEYDELKD